MGYKENIYFIVINGLIQHKDIKIQFWYIPGHTVSKHIKKTRFREKEINNPDCRF